MYTGAKMREMKSDQCHKSSNSIIYNVKNTQNEIIHVTSD